MAPWLQSGASPGLVATNYPDKSRFWLAHLCRLTDPSVVPVRGGASDSDQNTNLNRNQYLGIAITVMAKKRTQNEGVLYVALGENYVEAARRSARSLRRVMPRCRIALASDLDSTDDFDERLRLPRGDGYRAKIIGMSHSPFDRTVMLDADTYVVADFSDVFLLLNKFDMALAHAPNRITLPLPDVPDSFPEFNTGVVAYRRNRVTRRVFRKWLRQYDEIQIQEPPSKDQPSLRRVAYSDRSLRIATLTSDFNQRFTMAGYTNQPVRILHGWADESTYERVALAMTRPLDHWSSRAVFINGQLFDACGVPAEEWPV